MNYGSPTSTQQLLNGIALGFRQTPFEILLSFLLVIALLLLVSLYFVSQRRRAHRELARRSREVLEHLLGKLDLSDEETALLGRLALYLDRRESEHALLVDRNTFDECARKLRLAEDVSDVHLAALRMKVGFSPAQAAKLPASSTELPEGSPVVLAEGAGARMRGTIIGQAAGVIVVKLSPGSSLPAVGHRFTLYFHNSAGIFSFPTKCKDRKGDEVSLEQSSEIVHHQRREFYRRKQFLPVFIKSATASGAVRQSYLLDLGGGGASLQNPRGLLINEGDLLELSFSPEIAKLTVAARVIRVSKISKVVNVKFESISEAERHRIMSFLVAQSERRGETRSR